MSNLIGTPDWQRGVINAGKLLATVPDGTYIVDVEIPPNAVQIMLALAHGQPTGTIVVSGDTTAMYYPGWYRWGDEATDPNLEVIFDVNSHLDPSVTITVSTSASFGEWYVIALTSPLVVDVPELIGINQTRGSFETGAGIMAYALAPTTRAAALNVDGAGNLITSVVAGSFIAAPGAATPADALLVAGTDGTDLRALSTDSNGRQVPLVAVVSTGIVEGTGVDLQIIAAPTEPAWYLFGADFINQTTATQVFYLKLSVGTSMCTVQVPAGGGYSVSLEGFRVSGIVLFNAAANAYVTLRYAPGP